MRRVVLSCAVTAAFLMLVAAARADDAKPPAFDPLSVFATPLLDKLAADRRCDDVRPAAETVVKTVGDDVKTDFDAMRKFEHCASLSRLGANWEAYTDYAVLGAAASAYLAARSSDDARLYERALRTAQLVHGYDPGFAGKVMQVYSLRSGPDDPGPTGTRVGDPNATAQGPVIYKTVIKAVDATVLKTELGEMATQIGALAQSALPKK